MAEPSLYQSLEASKHQIRLINLLGPNDNGTIECSLATYSLDDKPVYVTLSYVWGDPNITKDVIVNGKKFAATTNLVAALENLPEAGVKDGVKLWIDAISINQNDVKERNEQVKLMGDIYKNCERLIAWLGPEKDNSTEVLNLFTRLVDSMGIIWDGDGVRFRWTNPPQDILLSETHTRILDIAALLTYREYWNRAWIYQELKLAPEAMLLCGTATLLVSDTVPFWLWFITTTGDAPPPSMTSWDWVFLHRILLIVFKSIQRTISTASDNQRPSARTWKHLQRTLPLTASDPRDKIYSLLSLTDLPMVPDYSKSTKRVYIELASILIGDIPLHDWLRHAGIDNVARLPGLPSWVIDWSNISYSEQAIEARSEMSFDTDLGLKRGFESAKVVGEHLIVSGLSSGTVKKIAPYHGSSAEALRRNIDASCEFDLTAMSIGDEIVPGNGHQAMSVGLASIFVCLQGIDLVTYTQLKPGKYTILELCLAFLYAHETLNPTGFLATKVNGPDTFRKFAYPTDDMIPDGWTKGRPGDEVPGIEAIARAFTGHFPTHYKWSRHFYTSKGLLGTGPVGILENDIICVLSGSNVPIVLRKSSPSHYVLVGPCYVLGMMEGEAYQMLERGEATKELFMIE